MDGALLASPASPLRCTGFGRRHSPWTATRQRKKNRGVRTAAVDTPHGDEHLPPCISEDDDSESEGEREGGAC